MALSAPPGNLAAGPLDTVSIAPSLLVRVTRFPGTEPYFGKGRSCRLDVPLQGYGVVPRALFDRCRPKLATRSSTRLLEHPKLAEAIQTLGIDVLRAKGVEN